MIVSSPKSILGWQGFYQMIRLILLEPDLLEHCKLNYFPTGITPDGDLYDHYSSTIFIPVLCFALLTVLSAHKKCYESTTYILCSRRGLVYLHHHGDAL
ncbi:hypothetical protein PRUPE_3G012700 [Prunus persica]|uniref:Uncharacterized protein n=1 Tax=Prunus persica TaxID=3760 RepID=A0A251PTN3_PRUPE|nr:hypothetical protein PRUPE_3G012700 [Prunus persica]